MARRMLGRKNSTKDIKAIRALNKITDSAIACRVYNNADISHTTSGDYEAVTFNAERRDAMGMHSTSSNTSRITVPVAGWYYVWGNITFEANATGVRLVELRVGGSTVIARNRDNAQVAGAGASLMVSTLYYLGAADYVEMYAYQSSGGALDIKALSQYSPEFAVAKFPFNDTVKSLGS